MDTNKERIIADILQYELDMFLAVPNENKNGSCQQFPNAFTIMRKVSHIVQDSKFLVSYLEDLKKAVLDNRNLMTEKYACMAFACKPLQQGCLLDKIIKQEVLWAEEAQKKYPQAVRHNETAFKSYLQCELQTFSEQTLVLYWENIEKAVHENKNLVIQRYEYLMEVLGCGSIEQKEAQLKTMNQAHLQYS